MLIEVKMIQTLTIGCMQNLNMKESDTLGTSFLMETLMHTLNIKVSKLVKHFANIDIDMTCIKMTNPWFYEHLLSSETWDC